MEGMLRNQFLRVTKQVASTLEAGHSTTSQANADEQE